MADQHRLERIADAPQVIAPSRIETGVHRLDDILGGGLLRGGVYLVAGVPGAGKTILANQLCFNRARRGETSVFVTMLAESHGRMLGHLEGMEFFDVEQVGSRIHYVSGFPALNKLGLDGVRDLLRKMIQKRGASMLVVDGVQPLERRAENALAFQRFVRELQTFGILFDCTVMLLSPSFAEDAQGAAMVDGVIELTHRQVGPRAVRELAVHKMRGSAALLGRHEVQIGPRGLLVHPRTEVAFASPPEHAAEDRARVQFGVPALDAMLGGGVLSSSATMLLGAAGTGKTVLGLQFLAEGARRGEPGVYFGFYETPPRLVDKAHSLGIDLQQAVDAGLVEIQWQPPLEHNMDSLAERLLERIRERKVPRMRLFIDGVSGFRDAAVYPDRLKRFFSALTHQLRELDVTTVVAEETPLFHANVELPNEEFAAIVENIVLLRHVEFGSELRRLVAILKSRESAYDSHIREFFITPEGIRVADTFDSASHILTGSASFVDRGVEPKARPAGAVKKIAKKRATTRRRR
ncbi:MAG: uncharacterized protein JWP97_4973 [Labilithrix sp.]|nr:uncharacterized protein [Labilithrix sp.]